MTATDDLRRLLDERGVEWASSHEWEGRTFWPNNDGINAISTDWGKGLLVHAVMTPEQAVEATLGRGTCHAVFEVDAMSEDERIGEFVCSECGETFGDVRDQLPHYCPACGKRVVE